MKQTLLNNEELGFHKIYSKPFWFPLMAMLLLSLSFMEYSQPIWHSSGNASGWAVLKFSMHNVAYIIMGFLFIRYYKGRIPNSTDLKLYVTYCILLIFSVFFFAFRTGDVSVIMFARAYDLTLFGLVILVFARMEIKDSFLICIISLSAPVFIILLGYLIFPEMAVVYAHDGKSVYRLGGYALHPNAVGGLAAVSLIMILGTTIGNFFKLLLSLIFLMVVIATKSRTALLALLFSLFASHMMAKGRVANKVALGMVLFLVLIAGLFAYQQGLLIELLPERMFKQSDTLSGRTTLWSMSLQTFFNGSAIDILWGINPFFATKTFVVNTYFSAMSLHNSYLHVLIGCGIFAAIIYSLMLVRLLRVRGPRMGLTLSLRALAIFIIIFGFTELTAAAHLNYNTILLALLIAQCYRQENIDDTKFPSSQPI